jgi:DNA polymerase II small subunit
MEYQDIINFYLDNDILISPDILKELQDKPLPLKSKFTVLNKDTLNIINNNKQVVVEDFEKALVLKEKHKNTKLYDKFIEYLKSSSETSQIPIQVSNNLDGGADALSSKELAYTIKTSEIKTITEIDPNIIPLTKKEQAAQTLAEEDIIKNIFLKKTGVKIISSYNTKSRKWSVHDFVSLYQARFKELEKILRSRQELQNLTSIYRITQKKERENVAIIGVVYEKAVTKTGNIMLTIEDPTGMIKTVVNKNKEELFRLAEEIQLDEVIGVAGMFDQIVFVNSMYIPDIPLTKELKKSPEEGYFVVIADTEPGSKLFLEKEFEKFIAWVNGDIGTEKQRDVASKIKYIFIAGDLVNGVGIYPGQEFDLKIIDIRDQYKALADLLKQLPEHIPIIICPGNHDVGRISEPQPALTKEYAEQLISLPNVVSVSNPSMINIFAQPEKGFDGFDVLLYHGNSFIYYSEHIPNIRKLGGQKRPDLIMKYLLQRRHLAPTHTSTLFIPDPTKDPLVMDKIPDFFISGHVHRAMVSNYKNVTCINASCWVAQSDEQERRGLEAQPARAFIIDMHTREAKIMNFLSKEEQDKENPIIGPIPVEIKSTENKSESKIDSNESKENKESAPLIAKEVTHG